MNSDENEIALKKATQDVLLAEKSLRELAERVKTYPEAAQRLNEVCSALDRAAASLQTVAGSLAGHEKAMQRAVDAIEKMHTSMLSEIKTVTSSLEKQMPLLEKAAGKKGIVF